MVDKEKNDIPELGNGTYKIEMKKTDTGQKIKTLTFEAEEDQNDYRPGTYLWNY